MGSGLFCYTSSCHEGRIGHRLSNVAPRRGTRAGPPDATRTIQAPASRKSGPHAYARPAGASYALASATGSHSPGSGRQVTPHSSAQA